ncbi:hypothetical protein VTL71DRAFT_2945 [Oculimacula yallundae]|uniref:Transmembrane protein n=1 Tax=Oculimacula yallundae TaxID=86028 RepID=A0ABR4C5S0_9HELO
MTPSVLPIVLLTLLAPPILSLTIPPIMPSKSELKYDKDNKPLGRSGLTLGCAATLGIGVLFGIIFLVWFGLVIYHSAAALFVRSDDDEELMGSRERRKRKEKAMGGKWGRRLTAASVLGAVFGLVFATWGVIFVWNMVGAVDLLMELAKK